MRINHLIKFTAIRYTKLDFVYYLLVVIRIVLTFIPQTGYIHPDEFFQSIEVVAGNVINRNYYKKLQYTLMLKNIQQIIDRHLSKKIYSNMKYLKL